MVVWIVECSSPKSTSVPRLMPPETPADPNRPGPFLRDIKFKRTLDHQNSFPLLLPWAWAGDSSPLSSHPPHQELKDRTAYLVVFGRGLLASDGGLRGFLGPLAVQAL